MGVSEKLQHFHFGVEYPFKYSYKNKTKKKEKEYTNTNPLKGSYAVAKKNIIFVYLV